MDTSKKGIVLATLGAAAAATLILFVFVLPAEFGIDPFGTGKALGIVGLSETAPSQVHDQAQTIARDTKVFVLAPFESVEYKYWLPAEGNIIFSWSATTAVEFDLHGEPDDGGPEKSVSYSIGSSDGNNGVFEAPFAGIHGWFWENRGENTVTVELEVAGFYEWSRMFRDGGEQDFQAVR